MNQATFISILENDKDRLKHRDQLVITTLMNPKYVEILLTNMEAVEDENSNFSARILELSCKSKLGIIIPYLDKFCQLLPIVKQVAVIRACAKICELLILGYFNKNNIGYSSVLQDHHLEKIIEAGFDWMITDQKTAVKAYTMQTLYLLGTKYEWIHPELVLNIEKDIPTATIGYVNRGRKVIKAIETKTKLKL
ncbi:adenylosuccinate lyase [Aureibaculum sp. 2210JD6-5]|uniref:adenylosuccinate lyase n=1 Tax=Aureibaculum sp. 2210JD6-5 TaxID=3103957 RepID=UPI002AACF688|nr:adenylosuccinate lyase [Aureibaculum sp. 2210JD6-5]MDY7396658.1 adenylosuccinate lyase [Aureibaculum sp. 2210JD6-5]